MGGNLLEMLWCSGRSREEILAVADVEGLEELKAAHAEGAGVLIATSHLGNWELVGSVAALVAPVSGIAKRLRAGGIEGRLLAMRERTGSGF